MDSSDLVCDLVRDPLQPFTDEVDQFVSCIESYFKVRHLKNAIKH